jgi:hypothetical protein
MFTKDPILSGGYTEVIVIFLQMDINHRTFGFKFAVRRPEKLIFLLLCGLFLTGRERAVDRR